MLTGFSKTGPVELRDMLLGLGVLGSCYPKGPKDPIIRYSVLG